MVDKFKSVLKKHKYALSIFVFFIIYNFVIVRNFSFPAMDALCYHFHIVDYSLGFCPQLLPGAIYNALFPTTQADVVNLYFNIIYHLFLLVVSFMLEKFLYRFDLKNRFIALIIVLFFITGPVTFAMHTEEIGMLDTYWLFFSAAFLIMIQNKYLKWAVPIIFALSIFVHIGAVTAFIPFFALIVLLEASRSERINKSYMSVFIVSVLLSVAVFVFFTAFEESHLKLSFDDFLEYMSERNKSDWEDWPVYYAYALYRVLPESYGVQMKESIFEGSNSFLLQSLGVLLRQVEFNLRYTIKLYDEYLINFARDVIVSMPIVFYLYKFVWSFFKKEKENKLRHFIWFCALCLLPFTFVTSILCSIDLIRWFGHGVICLFTLVMYELYRSSDNDYLDLLNTRFNKSSYFAVVVYFVLYMSCTVNPYT